MPFWDTQLVSQTQSSLKYFILQLTELYDIHTSISPDAGFFILGFLILLVGLPAMRTCLSTTSQVKKSIDTKVYLALCCMITPTCVAWPKDFTALLKNFIDPNSTRVEIDLIQTMDLICQGVIELRDPSDLSRLIRGTLKLSGIPFNARIDAYWCLKTTIWISFQSSYLYHFLRHTNLVQQIQPVDFNAEFECLYFDLDRLQYLDLRKEVFRIKQQLLPKSSAILEFSCLSPEAGPMSFEYMACTILFSPYIVNTKLGKSKNRTAIPLFTKVQDIVALLSTGTSIIENISNVSREHAKFLCAMEGDLAGNSDIRQAHIVQVGLDGWREDRLLLLWEANLLLSGVLTRWRINIRREQ